MVVLPRRVTPAQTVQQSWFMPTAPPPKPELIAAPETTTESNSKRMTQAVRPGAFSLIFVGVAGGILSGLFGIGGGTIIVPALALWLSMPHKLSAGTSVA